MTALRWEWRTFGAEFDGAEARLTGLPRVRVDDSEELYILSSRVEGSIKIRDGKLDVKRLERVSEDGLEQWNPVAKAEFPIAATDVASLLAALDVSVPSLHRERYALDELIADVVEPHDDLVAVPVRKHRDHYLLDGCRAELTGVRSGPRRTRTVAVEDEDPRIVRSTVEALGLWSRSNVSFPRGLAGLAGLDWW